MGFSEEELGFVFYDGECVKMDRIKLGFYAELTLSKQC